MLIHRPQCFPNNKSALAQTLETHSFQGPDISFVLPTRETSDSHVLSHSFAKSNYDDLF